AVRGRRAGAIRSGSGSRRAPAAPASGVAHLRGARDAALARTRRTRRLRPRAGVLLAQRRGRGHAPRPPDVLRRRPAAGGGEDVADGAGVRGGARASAAFFDAGRSVSARNVRPVSSLDAQRGAWVPCPDRAARALLHGRWGLRLAGWA